MTHTKPDQQDWPQWDDAKATKLLGSIVIVGLTYNRGAEFTEQLQLYGVVTVADKASGIAIECHGQTRKNETFWLPPDVSAFQPAQVGNYWLRSTGETVVDPDFVTSFTITSPQN